MFDNISRCLPCSSLKFAQWAGAIWGAAYEVSNACAIFDPLNLSSYPLIIVGKVHCTIQTIFKMNHILPCHFVKNVIYNTKVLCEILSRSIQWDSDELWPGLGFFVHVHYDLDFGDMTLGQVQDTPLDLRE